jgi:hypothetical protein
MTKSVFARNGFKDRYMRALLRMVLTGLAITSVCTPICASASSSVADTGLKVDDLTMFDIQTPNEPGVCATGYRRAYMFRATPDTAPLVFIDRANTALIRLGGKTIELKSVAHLTRDQERIRSFAAADSDISVEQTFRETQEHQGNATIAVLRGTIKVVTKTGSTTLKVVGKPGC